MAHALTVKGQVTVPKAIRQHLGVGPGHAVEYEALTDGSVRMTAEVAAAEGVEETRAALRKWRGAFLEDSRIAFDPVDEDIAFKAAHAHAHDRHAGDQCHATPADFFIGAHASVGGWALLTRDSKRIQTSFPHVEPICPKA